MSYIRAKNRQTNSSVFLQNRLNTFTTPPMTTGDLYVEKNETIGGNLDVSGNLTVRQDLRAKNFYASGNYYLNNYVLIPAGTIIQSAATTIPGGWLLCDGSSLLVLEYQSLFNAIAYTYGGATTNFNIPDARGRTTVGSGTGTASGNALTTRLLGNKDGEEKHALSQAEMPPHTHSLLRKSNLDEGSYDRNNINATESSACTTDRTNLGNVYFNTNSTGSGTAHNVMQPFIVFNYLIKY